MDKTRAAIVKLFSGKTIHGLVMDQDVNGEEITLIKYKDVELLGQKTLEELLQHIPLSQVKEIDFCTK